MYPNAAPVKGRWVCIKCDSGPGRFNMELLTYLQFVVSWGAQYNGRNSGDGPKLWSVSVKAAVKP